MTTNTTVKEKKVSSTKSFPKIDSSSTSSRDTQDNSLVVSHDLAASVASVCFSKDTAVVAKGHCRGLNREELQPVRKSRREKEAIRKRIYHQKLKDERNSLRKTVDELSQQLQGLKQVQVTKNQSLNHSVWKDFTVKEREKLQEVKTEQVRLLAAIEANSGHIGELCNHLPLDMTAKFAANRSAIPDTPISPPFDHTMFRGHLMRVHESHTLVDEIFDVDSMKEGIVSSVKRRELGGEIEYFELRNKFTQPFRYDDTERILWKLAKLEHRQQDREVFEEVADPNDTIVVRFRLVHTLTCGSTVSVLQRHVVCRFVEHCRTVHVWKTHSEGEGIFRGMHSDETGWFCVRPTLDKETAEVMVCIRQAPMKLIISNSGDDAPVEEFHDILQSSVSEDMLEVTSQLDKLLLEDTLEGIEI